MSASPQLIYSLVARGNTILAEYTENSGNFCTICQSILDKIPAENLKCTYVYDRYLFHCIREEGIVYLCLADEDFGRRVPFAFLEQIKRDFASYKAGAAHAIAYSFNREFSPVLARQMVAFSKDGGSDALSKTREEVQQVKHIMVQNVEKLLQRGEQIDLLVDKAEDLQDEASRFKKSATKLKNRMWWQNKKFCLILIVVVLVIALILGLVIWEKTKPNKH